MGKRKGPRYVNWEYGTRLYPRDAHHKSDMENAPYLLDEETVVRLLNAGERAKAELKRLKAALASATHVGICEVCDNCGPARAPGRRN